MTLLLRRAARSAASLSKFSRSAPEKPGERLERNVLFERLVARMHLENLLPATHVRAIDDDLPVEATRAQQRGLEDVRTIGRRDQDYAGILVEAVHLDE